MDNITIIDDAMEVGLPKWPAMVVVGNKVTPEQAAEIIIRTDMCVPNFSYASNDREFDDQLSNLFGVPNAPDPESYQKHYDRLETLQTTLKIIPVEYLNNHQIVSSYVGGPHGWCDWNGNIFCNTYNIGKWPSVEEVTHEWAQIAEAFPYLDLQCHLYDKESCEEGGTAIVEFIIRDGTVTVCPPSSKLIGPMDNFLTNAMNLLAPGRERGITITYLTEQLNRIYGTIPQY